MGVGVMGGGGVGVIGGMVNLYICWYRAPLGLEAEPTFCDKPSQPSSVELPNRLWPAMALGVSCLRAYRHGACASSAAGAQHRTAQRRREARMMVQAETSHTDDPGVTDVGGHALLPEAEVAAVGHYVGVVSINHLHPHSLASASPPPPDCSRLCHNEPMSCVFHLLQPPLASAGVSRPPHARCDARLHRERRAGRCAEWRSDMTQKASLHALAGGCSRTRAGREHIWPKRTRAHLLAGVDASLDARKAADLQDLVHGCVRFSE